MNAVVINHYGDREQLEVIDMPIPKIKSDEILIENMATSINPIDYKAREGLLKRINWQ